MRQRVRAGSRPRRRRLLLLSAGARAGVLRAGALRAGVLRAGVLLAGVLPAGVLLAGTLLAGTLLMGVALVGCDPQSKPLTQYEGGARVTGDGRLVLWMGAVCARVTGVDVQFNDRQGDPLETWILTPGRRAAPLSYLTVGKAPRGFRESRPVNTDWRIADTLRIRVRSDAEQRSTYLSTDSLTADSAAHVGQWFVQDHGWMSMTSYRDLVRKDAAVAPMCPR